MATRRLRDGADAVGPPAKRRELGQDEESEEEMDELNPDDSSGEEENNTEMCAGGKGDENDATSTGVSLDPTSSQGQKYAALQREIVLLIDKAREGFVGDPEKGAEEQRQCELNARAALANSISSETRKDTTNKQYKPYQDEYKVWKEIGSSMNGVVVVVVVVVQLLRFL